MTRSASFRAGLRAGAPFAVAGFLLSLSFGVLAREIGMPALAVIAMSVVVFAGSAQFAAVAILGAGGGGGAAGGAPPQVKTPLPGRGGAPGPPPARGPWEGAAPGGAGRGL